MFGMVKRVKRIVRDRTVYMEVYGDNKVSYRVTAGRMTVNSEDVITYGIEAEDLTTGEKSVLPDFSRDIEDAVDFAEMLISARIHPSKLYSRALNYLSMSI